jgi:two-component system NtrC family response regulator
MKTILVIDDDRDFRTLLARVLGAAGYTVATAADGQEGLNQFATLLPDLVLTDLCMPVKEGIEVITELHSTHPQTKIIAMSSGGQGGHTVYLKLAKKLGATRQLEKPFSIQDLLITVQEVLECKPDATHDGLTR